MESKQCFERVKCSFSARSAKNGLSAIYANVSIPSERKYLSVSLKVKVRDGQFNREKGLCVVSNTQCGRDNYNNKIANEAIAEFIRRVAEVNAEIDNADNPRSVNVENLMFPKKVREVRLDDLFFSIADRQEKAGVISASARNRKVSVIKSFCSFYKGAFGELNTEVYNGYSQWLVSQGKNISTINAYLAGVKTLVGEVNKLEKYPFVNTQNWGSVCDKRSKEEKRSTNIMFTDGDLASIEALVLDGRLAIVRDFFVFNCNVGQRPSDCVRILQGECNEIEHKGRKFIEIIPHKTKKTGCTATIPVNGTITRLMEKFRQNADYMAEISSPNFDKFATLKLKRIFELAGISKVEEVTAQNGNDKKVKKVSSGDRAHLYLARHYFITKMIREGVQPADLVKMTGHSSTNMINDIYTHLSSTDRCDIIAKYLE